MGRNSILNNPVWWNRIALFVLFTGLVILGIALTLQPKISDEWYLIWNYQDGAGSSNFMLLQYTQWTGRFWGILLATFVLPNPTLEIAYRAFIVVEILLLVALAWYCAIGHGAWRKSRENYQAMAIFGSLLWLALPVRDETVAWLAGNFVYLVSALFGLAFMAWIERNFTVSPVDHRLVRWRSTALGTLSFLVGFAAGVSHEQVVAACAVYLLLVARRLKCERNLQGRKFGSSVWITTLGFVVGAAVLVFAPGNQARMTKIASPSVFEIIERMVLYVPGAFFEIGTGNSGKNIWLAGLVFILLHLGVRGVSGEMSERLKRGIYWWIISLCSLLVMAPATNFISPRTSFFAVIFLFIGFAAMASHSPIGVVDPRGEPKRATYSLQMERLRQFSISTVVLIVLACLVLVEAVAGLISNVAVAKELDRRIEIVELARRSAVNADLLPIRVPFIATQPATLTYIQSPEHDREFLTNWSRRIGRPIQHDVSEDAPLPNSFKPLKAIKYRHRD